MISSLVQVFGTLTKALEVLYVMERLKPVARLSVLEHELDRMASFCSQNSLHMETADFKVAMRFEGAYSTAGNRLTLNSSEKGHFFVYISSFEQFANDAKSAEADGQIAEFGKLLGYPPCCVNFFIQHRNDELRRRNDYVIPAFLGSEGEVFPFVNNIFGRYFDRVLINHAPCTFSCPASQAIGQKNLDTIKKHDISLGSQIEEFLKSAAVYTDNGVFLLLGSKKENKYIYENVVSTSENLFSKFLKSNNEILIKDKGWFVIDKEEFTVPFSVFQ